MTAQLIMKLGGNKYVNHSFFRPYLYIYEDIMIYKKRRKIIFKDEITHRPYSQIALIHFLNMEGESKRFLQCYNMLMD